MERLIEGVPGHEAAVWVQDRGGGPLRLRGHVVIEDLSGVLTSLSATAGANGPLNPVTQYMLARAAQHLADRLVDDAPPMGEGRESSPRILSSTLGHQPFVEQVLQMSQHQMLRRWPLATDWYTDVINYMMRPARFEPKIAASQVTSTARSAGTFGEFVRYLADELVSYADSEKVVRVAEALQALWPDYPPVRDAMAHYRRQVSERYIPLYRAAMNAYGLLPRPEARIEEIAWAFNSLQARETAERLAGHDGTHTSSDGATWTLTGWTGLVLIAGSVTDEEGRFLGLDELSARCPVRPFLLPDPPESP